VNAAALAVPRDDDPYGSLRSGYSLLPGYSVPSAYRGSRRAAYSGFDPWQDQVSYQAPVLCTSFWSDALLRGHSAVDAPATERARAVAANVLRGFPPAYKPAAAPGAQGTATAAPAQAALVVRRRVRPYRVFGAAAGRHRQQRAAVISPLRVTAVAVFLAGRKRGAEHDEWRSHLSELTRQGLSSRDQTPAALGFLWAALRLRLRDAAKLACGPVDALLRSRTLSNLLVLVPTLMAALYILRHLGTLGVLTSAEGISAIGGALYGLVRAGRWWRDVKPPEPKARRVKEQ
jgi:hypothetical protein